MSRFSLLLASSDIVKDKGVGAVSRTGVFEHFSGGGKDLVGHNGHVAAFGKVQQLIVALGGGFDGYFATALGNLKAKVLLEISINGA